PDNAVLVVAGRFEEPKALAKVVAHFGALPKPSRVLPHTYTEEPTQDGERSVTLRRVGDVQAVCAVYHVPPASHPDSAAADVLVEILADTPSGRLHKALVETQKASEVSGNQFNLREAGMLVVGAQVRQDMSLDEAKDILLATVEGLPAKPPTTEEVERART